MSRYGECDDEFWPNQAAMFEANIHRSLKGRRGRQALADLREALLALPEPRLISRALCTVGGEARLPSVDWTDEYQDILASQGEGVRAVGAYVWWQKVKAGLSPEDAFAALPTLPDCDEGIDETAREGKRAGLAFPLAWELAFRNDERYDTLTPEERHARFLAWIDKELAGEGATS